ncbi:MAG: hypothetical protein ACLQIB_20955 [Isosphaeraceae bacterium]
MPTLLAKMVLAPPAWFARAIACGTEPVPLSAVLLTGRPPATGAPPAPRAPAAAGGGFPASAIPH